jgi:hypothetical protein
MREVLSVEAQQWLERQDVDSVLLEWQIPLTHRDAFNELIRKGYLIKTTHQEALQGYKFADDIVAEYGQGVL